MSRLNDPENFSGRVNYAAAVISNGRSTSRAFDNCFENFDGDEVVAILLRRAEKNAKLAVNMPRYLGMNSVRDAAARLVHIKTRDMPAHARASRERGRAGGHD